ncbi:MAG: Imm26 family immunity protein [Flavobacteriales bacterium]
MEALQTKRTSNEENRLMGKRLKLRIGDIFPISLGNGEESFGQITSFARTHNVFYVCLFDYKKERNTPLDIPLMCSSDILFLGATTDSKFYHGEWSVVENYTNNISGILFPFHKIYTLDGYFLLDHKSKEYCKLTENVQAEFNNPIDFDPSEFETAIKMHFKLIPWDSNLIEDLMYSYCIKSNKLGNKLIQEAESAI